MLQIDKLKLPLIAAPMFLVSGPELVIECCQQGVIGTFPALNQRTTEGFEAWLREIEEALADVPSPGFGVNLIAHRSNPRLQADLEVCVRHKVPLIITSLGAVPELVDAVHNYGGQVFHDVINLRHARKAAEAGVDGLIAVSSGAGGHTGSINPFALLDEIRQFFDKTLVLSGSLSSGRDIAAAQAAGADYAYMGTRFICTRESYASDGHKRMIEASAAIDIVYTDEVSGVSGNFLKDSLPVAGAEQSDKDQGEKDIDFGKELTAPRDDATAWKDIWSAGHGVGAIHNTPTVQQLVQELHGDYQAAIERLMQSPYRMR